MDSGHPATTLTRRTALRAGALAAVGLSATGLASRSARARADDERVTVATRNLGLGANLFALFFVRSPDELAETVGTLYGDVRDSAVPERMAAVAEELAAHEPDVVGIQEAALVRTDAAAEATTLGETNAEDVVADYLAELTAALSERGTPYRVAQVTTNADAEFPAATDEGRLDVRLTDRDAVLVREGADVTVESTSNAAFDAALDIPIDGESFRVERGYGVVRATVRGRRLSVVNAHLESASERVRNAQATQLSTVVSSLDGPLVVLGDVNDGPAFGGGAYETLTTDLADAWATVRPDDAGYTCCQLSTLDNQRSQLDERVDHVLVSGLTPASAVRVGASASDRVTAPDGRTLWPSDHAGVVATLDWRAKGSAETDEAPAGGDAAGTATPTNRTADATGTAGPNGGTRNGSAGDAPAGNATSDESVRNGSAANASGSGSETPAVDAPGFGPVAALAGVAGGVAELARRARRGGD